ncbi:ABC transporter ATP-binding protein [Vibrio nigripulchritudo]|uniref:ABC transporter ATP-binding protein n=1 Tax=Vibrio nigripulchritudo TaxID=28173 RepID=UPI0005FA7F90|nr:ABC transporter ATP-binding protein [Vibrio nigripulchritudo]KJY80620.1 iron ABC transporter ATP-binding protein [Vibrio nigripulchritudo]
MIKVQNLVLKAGDTEILSGYELNITQGEVLAIMGANGVGKTTLLNALIGNKKPDSGSVSTNGIIGYVPQLFDMPFSYSVLDIVLMGRARYLGLTGSPSTKDFELAHHYLEMMQIHHLHGRNFNQLSGGQKQLVMIAQALTSECDILILDEPCSALDYHNQAIVLSKIRQLNQELGMTVVYTTHMPQHALETATHVLLMNGQSQYLHGTTETTLNSENLTKLYGIRVDKAVFQSDDSVTLAPRFEM